MLILTVKNSNGFPCLVPVLLLLFSNNVVDLQNIKHDLCVQLLERVRQENQILGQPGLHRFWDYFKEIK